MKYKIDYKSLRKKAENLASKSALDLEELSSEEIIEIIHELEVHQIELKMQNEELKRFQEELDHERIKYERLYNHAPVGYVTLDSKQNIIQANETIAQMLNCSKSVIEHHPFNDFIHWDDKDIFYLFIINFNQNQDLKSCQLRLNTKGSSWVYVNLEANLEKNNFISLAISDISELINTQKKAEESNNLKSAFLSNMSHEIRTPMNAILGFAELLGNDTLTISEKQTYLNSINQAGGRLLRLITDILDLSKIESEQISIIKKPCNINQLIDDLLDQIALINNNSKVSITLKKGLNNKACNIITDEQRLTQILSNLITNALKFTPEGTIEIGYIRKNSQLEFFVKDSGIGISAEDQKIIFDRFEQAQKNKRQLHEGAGLGLSIVKGLLELLEGEIWVESELNEGSTFYFTIPFSTSTSTKVLKDAPVHEIVEQPSKIKEKTILIVEDNLLNHFLLETFLKDLNVTLLSAYNGQEAVDQVKQNPSIDIVLLDINMPIMNGYDAIKQIKEFNQNLPIIAQTGYGMEEDIKNILDAGFDDYLIKPVDQDSLIKTLRKHIDKS